MTDAQALQALTHQVPPPLAASVANISQSMQALTHQVQQLIGTVHLLANQLSPWLTMADMCTRFKCSRKTIDAKEQRGEIPQRTHGRWLLTEVIEFQNLRKPLQ